MSRRSAWVAVLTLSLAVSFTMMVRMAGTWRALISLGYPDVRWVDSETLSEWMNRTSAEELVLVDVRTPEEQQVSHLKDALHVNARNPDIERLAIPASARVVVYCSIGYRSATIIEKLQDAGIGNIYNLEGGLFEWANQGRPVYRGGQRVNEVHPYNRAWGLLLRGEYRATALGVGR